MKVKTKTSMSLDTKLIKLAKKQKKEYIDLCKKALSGKKISNKYSSTWIGDISDTIKVLNFIIKNPTQHSKIDSMICDMDTDAREYIDDKIWDIIRADDVELDEF